MARNDLGVPQITRIVSDPDSASGQNGQGVLKGRAVLYGPERNQVQLGTEGFVAGVAHYNRKDGEDNAIQTEGFAEVESAGAVEIGAPVYVADAEGRVGASGTARVGTATSSTSGAGERLNVDLATRGQEAAASA